MNINKYSPIMKEMISSLRGKPRLCDLSLDLVNKIFSKEDIQNGIGILKWKESFCTAVGPLFNKKNPKYIWWSVIQIK